jgi:hypothetical protein
VKESLSKLPITSDNGHWSHPDQATGKSSVWSSKWPLLINTQKLYSGKKERKKEREKWVSLSLSLFCINFVLSF